MAYLLMHLRKQLYNYIVGKLPANNLQFIIILQQLLCYRLANQERVSTANMFKLAEKIDCTCFIKNK